MSEAVKELTVEQQAFKERLDQELERCGTEEEAYNIIMRELNPDASDSGELGEEALDLVVGGMSNGRAVKIVATAYWDLCIWKKGRTSYSSDEIFEALRVCNGLNQKIKGVSWTVLKWGLGQLGFEI